MSITADAPAPRAAAVQRATAVPTIVVKVNGSPMAPSMAADLTSLRVERALRVPARARLRFVEPRDSAGRAVLDAVGKLGAPLEVELGWSSPTESVFKGLVSGLEVQQTDRGEQVVVVTALDKSARLARSCTVATHEKVTYADVIKKMATAAGLSAKVGPLSGQHDWVLQCDNDLQVLDALADRTGFDWWVDGDVLHFTTPRAGANTPCTLYEDLRELTVRASALAPDEVEVRGWDAATKKSLVGQGKPGAVNPDVQLATGPVKAYGESRKGLGGGGAVLRRNVDSPSSAAESKDLAEATMARLTRSSVTARGVLEMTPGLAPTSSLAISAAGALNGTYLVSAVEHVYDGREVVTRFTAGERRPTGLVDELGAGGRRPAVTSHEHAGLVVGVVTNNNDPDKRGRVKVRFPTLSDQLTSHWARVASLGGGADRGFVALPEIDDQVLVAFEGSDVRRPVVLGGLHSDKDKSPAYVVTGGKVQGRRFTSRTGHVLELGDGQAPSAAHVLLELMGGKERLRLGKDRFDLEMPAGKPISIKVGQSSITLDGNGKIEIQGLDVIIKGRSSVQVQGGKVDVKGDTALNLEGGLTAKLKGGVTQVESIGATTVKGAVVNIN